jgi:hypothetical protein
VRIRHDTTAGAGKSNVTLSVDTEKFHEDRKWAVKGAQNLGKANRKANGKARSRTLPPARVMTASGQHYIRQARDDP